MHAWSVWEEKRYTQGMHSHLLTLDKLNAPHPFHSIKHVSVTREVVLSTRFTMVCITLQLLMASHL